MTRKLLALLAASALAIAPATAQIGPGPGGGGGSGTVTQINTSCGLTGGPITTSGTVQTTLPPNAQTGTTFTPTAASNCGQSVTLTNASAIAVSLVAANWTTTSNYFNAYVKNTSTGSATFTPTTGTIDGLASETFAPGTGATFIFDGTNWTTSGRYVNGPTSATTGDLPSFNGTSGQNLQDSGVAAANVATGPASATSGDLPSFNGTGGKALQDSGVPSANVVQGPGSAVNNNCAKFGSTTGKLIADSGVACGGGWQAVSGYKSGNWYRSLGALQDVTGALQVTDSTIYCHPFVVSSQGLTVKAAGVQVTTTGTGNVQIAIYKGDGTSGRPSTLVDQLSSAQTTTATPASGSLVNSGSGDALASGQYWVCIIADNTTVSTVRFTSIGSGIGAWSQPIVGAASVTSVFSASGATVGISCTANGTTGAGLCGSGVAAWASGAYTWTSLSAAQFSDVVSSNLPEIALQAF